jgi:hypothetical protein
MPFDPDTEIQYRKGGKIMKKTPRKFSAGGAAPAPTPKPAPKGGPKELQDEAEKLKQEARDKKQQEAGQRRPDLSKPFKKGGKVKKFSDGGETQPYDKDIYYTGRFKGEEGDDLYRKAYAQANRLREPSGAEVSEGKANTGLKEPSVRKAPSRPAFRRPAPKVSVAPSKRAEETKPSAPSESLSQGLGRKFAATDLAFRNAPKETSSIALAALKKARDDAESEYGKTVKMAKGGGVEAKGKTKGKVVKMARGGGVEVKGKTRGKVC